MGILSDHQIEKLVRIDPFDGGPIITCPTESIGAIRLSEVVHLNSCVDEDLAGESYLVSNRKRDFRCTNTHLQIQEKGIALAKRDAAALNCQVGDSVRILKIGH